MFVKQVCIKSRGREGDYYKTLINSKGVFEAVNSHLRFHYLLYSLPTAKYDYNSSGLADHTHFIDTMQQKLSSGEENQSHIFSSSQLSSSIQATAF